jgi:hypothetical protein
MTVTLHGKRFKSERPLWFSCDGIIIFSCNYQNMRGLVRWNSILLSRSRIPLTLTYCTLTFQIYIANLSV